MANVLSGGHDDWRELLAAIHKGIEAVRFESWKEKLVETPRVPPLRQCFVGVTA